MNGQRDDEYGSLNDLMGSFDGPVGPDSDDDRSVESQADAARSVEPDPDSLPEGLPAEYLEAFRRGYERARRGEEATVAIDLDAAAALDAGESDEMDEPRVESGESRPEAEAPFTPAGHEPTVAIPAAAVAEPSYREEASQDEQRRWLPVPMVAVAAVALVLILAAFGVGRLFADDGAPSAEDSSETSGSESSGGGAEGERAAYEGPVDAVTIAGGSATCQTAQSVDAAGNPTTYEPAKAFDSDLSTAWRCDGSGKGERFTITLPQKMTIAEIGLVPGYAKTDPVSGADRYAENNRITKVRWRFDDGTTYVQRMNGNPADRSMRTMRIPETSTATVVIQIVRSKPGPRNTVAISEIRLATPAG